MNIALFRQLREAAGRFVRLEELGSDPGSVWADLDQLIRFGFGLEFDPDQGAAYRADYHRLCPDQIEWELNTRVVGRRVAVYNRVASTNDLAVWASHSQANHGLAILAEEQTSGRGSRGRVWSAPPRSSILMSVLLFPPEPLDNPSWLTALGAVAVAEVVEDQFGIEARIKWPNDVRVEGRKLAGILVERDEGTVLGIGLNVNTGLEDFPEELRDSATSLARVLGRPVDRSELARSLLQSLDDHYDQAVRTGPDALSLAYQRKSEHRGRRVQVASRSATVVGRLESIDLQAGLSLALDDETTVRVPILEVLAISDPGA